MLSKMILSLGLFGLLSPLVEAGFRYVKYPFFFTIVSEKTKIITKYCNIFLSV